MGIEALWPWLLGVLGGIGWLISAWRSRRWQIRLAEALTGTTHLTQENHQLKERLSLLEATTLELRQDKTSLSVKLEQAYETMEREEKRLQELEVRVSDKFQKLAQESFLKQHDALLKNAESLLNRYKGESESQADKHQEKVKQLVEPISSTLKKMDDQIQALEKNRQGAYQGLRQQIESMMGAQASWQQEATRLSEALKSPVAQGRWGELQLRRIAELTGMVAHCDFLEQPSEANDQGSKSRPDMVVKLPGERQVIIDAKAPLNSYYDACQLKDPEEARKKFLLHAEAVRRHVVALGQRAYWQQFQPTPEFVVLFLPGEHYFSAAMQADPGLIEWGVDQRVIIATPTTLIALLRAVAYGWRQEALTTHAKEIRKLGGELYGRIADFSKNLSDVGKSLGQSINHYNKAVHNFDSRILVSARKFKEMGVDAGKKETLDPPTIEQQPRALKDVEQTL